VCVCLCVQRYPRKLPGSDELEAEWNALWNWDWGENFAGEPEGKDASAAPSGLRIYVYIYIYIYIYTNTYMYMHIYVCICVSSLGSNMQHTYFYAVIIHTNI